MDPVKNAVRDEYDRLSAHYEARWHRYVAQTVRGTLERAAIAPGERVLDVGCGSGALLRAVGRGIGADLSMAMLAEAKRNLRRLVGADAERLPFRAGRFDVVVSTSSFHFWPSPERALAEIRRVLRPGGRFVLTDWCDDFLACHVCDLFLRWRGRAPQRIYTAGECADLLRAGGFTVSGVDTYKVSWLWGVMTAVAYASPR